MKLGDPCGKTTPMAANDLKGPWFDTPPYLTIAASGIVFGSLHQFEDFSSTDAYGEIPNLDAQTYETEPRHMLAS